MPLSWKIIIRHLEKQHGPSLTSQILLYEASTSNLLAIEVIISCVTFADKNFAGGNVYQSGCVVIPVHSRGFQNCDTCFDQVFADDIESIRNFKFFIRLSV